MRLRSTVWLAGAAGATGFLLGQRRAVPEPPRSLPAPLAAVQMRRRAGWMPPALGALIVVAGCGAAALQWTQARQAAAIGHALTGGDPAGGPALMIRFGCGGCHTIPGVPGADGQVGPPLAGLLQRVFVGGVVRNTPANLVSWIVNPRALSPNTAMPATGITPEQARDVAAYLYSQ